MYKTHSQKTWFVVDVVLVFPVTDLHLRYSQAAFPSLSSSLLLLEDGFRFSFDF
jgi:hypothetical protein